MDQPRMVISVRSELPRLPLIALAIWFVATAVVMVLANDTWLWVGALVTTAGTTVALIRISRPRRGELMRLLLDLETRTVYWAHYGKDAEELPFGAFRAVAVEPLRRNKRVKLYAVDSTGRWVSLGTGSRPDLERFARAMASAMEIPLWYKQASYDPSTWLEPEVEPRASQPTD